MVSGKPLCVFTLLLQSFYELVTQAWHLLAKLPRRINPMKTKIQTPVSNALMKKRVVFALLSVCLSLLTLIGRAEVSVLDSEQRRLEQGQQFASGKEMRLWKFSGFQEPMQDWPHEVRGSFVELRGENRQFSEAVLILVRDDFRLRSYPAKFLEPADRALAEKLEAERASKIIRPEEIPYPRDDAHYTQAEATHCESAHFVFYSGTDTHGTGKSMFEDPGFLPRQQEWFETVWKNLGDLGAPLPMVRDPKPHKINVFITGTGLKDHREGFAFGSNAIIIHPNALGPGSSVVPHEFTHTVQYYSKSFRDSPFVGWFWECHANWSMHQFLCANTAALEGYAGHAHYELSSTRHNYGSWPFLQTLAENPQFGRLFPYAIWSENRRNEHGVALEDPFQTIMRMGTERRIWSDGVSGFGDLIGELAARMVAWDFQNQFFYQEKMRRYVQHHPGIPSHRTLLEPVSDRDGWWKPIFSQAPRVYGVNLVDLVPSAKVVEVDFSGIVDEKEGSDWRVTLVAYDALGHCRYSPTRHGGLVSLEVRKDEKLALAIAATPTQYTPIPFRPGFNKKNRYPYEVAFRGALPATTPTLPEIQPVNGAPHPNGGGFVARSASVAPSAFVGPNARVLDRAQVCGSARIEDFSVIKENAKVTGSAVVGGFARVTDHAEVSENARVSGFARLGGRARLGENARLLEYGTIDGAGLVSGDVLVKGFGSIHLQPATELTGGTICGEDLEVHFLDCDLPKVTGGMIYGFLDSNLLKKERADNHWLYAHWDFKEPRRQVLKDVNADCNGVLRGNPVFSKVGGREGLGFDGKTYALVEGQVINTRKITFDLQLAWNGGSENQRLFEFGDPQNSLYVEIQKDGRPVFVIHRGESSARVQSSISLLPHRYSRLTVTLGNSCARISIDGQLAAENLSFPLTPEEVRARAGRIGAGITGAGFIGTLADFAIYRTDDTKGSEIAALEVSLQTK